MRNIRLFLLAVLFGALTQSPATAAEEAPTREAAGDTTRAERPTFSMAPT